MEKSIICASRLSYKNKCSSCGSRCISSLSSEKEEGGTIFFYHKFRRANFLNESDSLTS